MEKFKAKQERAADTVARNAEKKRTENMGDDVLLAEVLRKVIQVVDNMENGDGVLINSLHSMFIGNPLELGKKDAVTILACSLSLDKKAPDTEIQTRTKKDFQIFSDLISDEFVGASELFGTLMSSGKYKPPEDTVPALVAAGVADKTIPAADAARLTELFKVWLKGVSWAKCRLSSTNRPSLGSWNGWPWDDTEVAQRSLNRGLSGSNVEVAYQMMPALTSFPPTLEPYVLQLWTSSSGRTADLEGAILANHAAYKAVVEAREATKGSSSSAGAGKKAATAKAKPAKPAKSAKPKGKGKKTWSFSK